MITVLLFAFVPLQIQAPERTITIPRLERPPQIEDLLVGSGRSQASGTRSEYERYQGVGVRVTDFRQREPGDGVPASQATTAYVSYDDANLYVIFVCSDDPAKVRARIAKREQFSADDGVLVYLDTFHDRQRAYVFGANPLGVQLDGLVTEGQSDDYSFDAVWHSDGRLTATGYIVRLVIPFRSLRFPNTSEQRWGIALARLIRRNNEKAYWPTLTKRVPGFVPQFGVAEGLRDISPGRNIQFAPYTTVADARFLDRNLPAFRTAREGRVGVDAKVVLRDAFTLDATVNPDFSQVESDDPQVTANQRFEVFFPELRPFFIENAGYFVTPVNLFFSRRVADPGRGLRLTGKSGRWAVGAIGIDDRVPGEVASTDPLHGRRAGIGAIRVQRELAQESAVGVLVTDRELAGSTNRVYAADGRVKLGRNWVITGQLMESETRELDGTRRSGPGYLLGLQRKGRHFAYQGSYLDLAAGFRAPLGFLERVDVRETEHKWEYRARPDGLVTEYGPNLKVLLSWDRQGRLQDRAVEASGTVALKRATQLDVAHAMAFELFDDRGFQPRSTVVAFETEWLRWLAASASYLWGTAVNHDPATGLLPSLGDATEAELAITLRPTPGLRYDQQLVFSRLTTRPVPGSPARRIFAERKLRAKLNYQFSRSLSVRAIADHATLDPDTTLSDEQQKRRWAVDVLLTYLVNPGTAFYFGYTDRYENLALGGSPPIVRRTGDRTTSVGRQLFAKLSYLFRF